MISFPDVFKLFQISTADELWQINVYTDMLYVFPLTAVDSYTFSNINKAVIHGQKKHSTDTIAVGPTTHGFI